MPSNVALAQTIFWKDQKAMLLCLLFHTFIVWMREIIGPALNGFEGQVEWNNAERQDRERERKRGKRETVIKKKREWDKESEIVRKREKEKKRDWERERRWVCVRKDVWVGERGRNAQRHQESKRVY